MSSSPEGSAPTGRQASESGPGYAARSAAYEEQTGYPMEPAQARAVTEGASAGIGTGIGRGLAGFLLIFNGILGFLVGLSAIIRGGFFAVHTGYAYHWSIHGWGWLQLIIGCVVFAAGVCVLLGMLWARIFGAVLAGFSAIASFMFIPYYPVWSIVVIAVDLFIVWALLSGGRRQAA